MRVIVVIALLFVFQMGCKKPHERKCWKAHGEAVRVDRNVSDFSEIEVHDAVNVVLIQDTVNQVFVRAGENVEPFVNVEVVNGILTLQNENKCDFLRDYDRVITVEVHAINLKKIVKHSTADITSDNTLQVPAFRLESYNGAGNIDIDLNTDSTSILIETGPSDVTLSGATDYFYLYHSGNGNAWCSDFLSNHTHVNSTTTGAFHVFASQHLNAEIFSYGNVHYYGNPADIVLTRTNRGELIEE